jgi:hypothetical protein
MAVMGRGCLGFPLSPVQVEGEVTDRDGESCTFVGQGGHLCGSRYAVQVHHRIAWAHGGSNTPENLTWNCGPHNRLVATREGLGRRSAGRWSPPLECEA